MCIRDRHIGGYLQPAFFKEKRGKSYAPFSRDLRQGEVDTIFMHAMHQTDRYRAMKKAGASEKEIKAAFNEPVEMRVFSWIRSAIIRVSCVPASCRWIRAPVM